MQSGAASPQRNEILQAYIVKYDAGYLARNKFLRAASHVVTQFRERVSYDDTVKKIGRPRHRLQLKPRNVFGFACWCLVPASHSSRVVTRVSLLVLYRRFYRNVEQLPTMSHPKTRCCAHSVGSND